jgi:orotate phosphoribosyltransferase
MSWASYNFPEAKERFFQANCPFETLSDFLTLISVAKNTGQIEESDIEFLSSWYTDPKAWQARLTPN